MILRITRIKHDIHDTASRHSLDSVTDRGRTVVGTLDIGLGCPHSNPVSASFQLFYFLIYKMETIIVPVL